MALPDELTHAQRVALVRDYAQAQFVDRGMVADIALHAPGREGDERNHHAHILLTTREVDADGFTTKNRDWNKVEVLEGWREAWALDSNAALERAGFDERVDHRTLAEQRDEALELAAWARMDGDEAAELHGDRAGHVAGPPAPAATLAGEHGSSRSAASRSPPSAPGARSRRRQSKCDGWRRSWPDRCASG